MKETETIDECAGKLSGMVSRYNSLGETVNDCVLVRKLLDSVADKFLQLIASIEQYSDIDTIPFEEAIGRLKAYEDRLKLRSNNTNNEGSLAGTSSHGRGRNSSNKERGGRSGGRGRGRGRGGRGSSRDYGGNRSKDKKSIKCYNCNNYRHYTSDCKSPKDKADESNLTRTNEEPALLLMVCEEEESRILLNGENVFPRKFDGTKRNMWYLDNGASNHMTGRRDAFADLDENVKGEVRFGDDSKVHKYVHN
ncbi:uncharacterized protein [Rutidosis leptorrhynchoides]|uniref:uncharacterized protein n=1 Tax=Rutidosis leptorrhynchoides TaxID=125765 RepID=UPI003A9A2A6A